MKEKYHNSKYEEHVGCQTSGSKEGYFSFLMCFFDITSYDKEERFINGHQELHEFPMHNINYLFYIFA